MNWGALAGQTLSPAEARSLTDEVKRDAEVLWLKLVDLHDGLAWDALGYSSWRDYWIAEFGEQTLWTSYKQISAGRVVRVIESGLERVPKPNLRQAIELSPLAESPDVSREAWTEASADGKPTAAQVREVADEDEAREIARAA